MLNTAQMPAIWPPEEKKWLRGLDTFLLQNRQGHLKRVVTACDLALEQHSNACRFRIDESPSAVIRLPTTSAHIRLPTISWSSRFCHGVRPAMVIRLTFHNLGNLAFQEAKYWFDYQDRFSALALASLATGPLVMPEKLACMPPSSSWFLVKQVIQKRLSCIWLEQWRMRKLRWLGPSCEGQPCNF